MTPPPPLGGAGAAGTSGTSGGVALASAAAPP
eukprot:CAMPEP_0176257260 /NCGR_PEP_ID=MMETSP0121_2-20121125/37960_1 /TAXON_ID=160619 /ORGANISM="Kryptoperidinium foliaceum, Strain CCMP 1326" /LENGTH=31 /DNA_ID= /DNA_START= /DNA_END= /DNA_ORIENTATION=